MHIARPKHEATPEQCREQLRPAVDDLIRKAVLAGWPSSMVAEQLGELASDLQRRIERYQREGLLPQDD